MAISPEHLPDDAGNFSLDARNTIQRWNHSLHNGSKIFHWSWYQLYIDYTLFSGHEGPWYNQRRLRWEDHSTRPGQPRFVRRCRWFSSYITKLLKCLNMEVPLVYQRPDSPVLGFWINTIAVRSDPQRHEAVNTWMAQWGPSFYISKDLKAIP